jgi:hypothetical protein
LVDTRAKEAWYLWLQEWLLKKRSDGGCLDRAQLSWIHWIPEKKTLINGLSGELKSIARWKGETQLILSLMDALRSAAATHDLITIDALTGIIATRAPSFADTSLSALIDQAITLGDRMRGTMEGNEIANQLFALVRKCGERISRSTVHKLVIRGDSYSRTGLAAIAILYDDFFHHMKSLRLPKHFTDIEPRVAFYCACREAFPNESSANLFIKPSHFIYAGLCFVQPEDYLNKCANRGPSALLDYLVPIKEA